MSMASVSYLSVAHDTVATCAADQRGEGTVQEGCQDCYKVRQCHKSAQHNLMIPHQVKRLMVSI